MERLVFSTLSSIRMELILTLRRRRRPTGYFVGESWQGGPDNYGTLFSLSTNLPAFVETNPSSGKVGKTVVIMGNNLKGSTAVKFNGTAAQFRVAANSAIVATVPTGATSGSVSVTTPKRYSHEQRGVYGETVRGRSGRKSRGSPPQFVAAHAVVRSLATASPALRMTIPTSISAHMKIRAAAPQRRTQSPPDRR